MQTITPFLWFDSQAEEAAKFYVSIFKKSKLGKIARYDADSAKATGRVMAAMMQMVKLDIRKLKQVAKGK
jgi:predicted 3-demethylubiquinone-9 3-methyltransferase (glyoxalase superfamily)